MRGDSGPEPRRRSSLFTSPALRRSLAAAAAAADSASKTSPGSWRASHAAAAPVEPFDIPQYDDEAERRQQRQQAAVASERRKSLPGIAGLSHGQLAAHYANCIKLSAENKINTKNAFSLQLIDCMAQMLRQKKSDLDNFQVASYTLDASAKIYGYRVEVLHGETLRMAGGLGRADAPPPDDAAQPADDDAAAGGDKRRRKARRHATVERNLANITGRAGGGAGPAPDALLRRMLRAVSDEGRAGSATFLGSLPTRDDSQELLVDVDCESAASPPPAEDDDDDEPPELTLSEVEGRLLCAPLQTFSFSGWSPEEERDDELPERQPPQPPQDLRHRFDMNAAHSVIQEEPLEDVFDDMDDDGGEPAAAADGGDTLLTVGRAGCRPAEAATLLSMVSAVPQEYSYFDTGRLLAWAGPKHWKLRPLLAGRPAAAPAAPRQRRRGPVDTIDYDSELDWQQAFAVAKKPIKLKPTTMKKWNEEKTTLPEDLHYDVASLFKLFLRPDTVIAREAASAAASESQPDLDGSVANYDYDNDRDTADYCPDLPQSEDCDDYDQEATFVPSGGGPGVWDASELLSATAAPSTGDLVGDNLVQAPKKVEKILISYARTAKKMDMRKLKRAMWDILVDTGRDDKENASGSPVADRKEATSDRMPPEREYSFRELYHRLPARLTSRMADNLSVALAFTALLHTANERCLSLAGARRLDDLFISQEVP